MEETKENYTVYMHKNKENGKVYIGITGVNPKKRWAAGRGYKNSTHFYRAINKYGWNNFEHLILFEGLTKIQAEEKEIELIRLYDSTNQEKGYNISYGGNSKGKTNEETKRKIGEANTLYKTIFQYDRNTGEFISSYETLKDTEVATGVKRAGITAVCKYRVKSLKGYIFRYSEGLIYGEPLTKEEMEKSKNTHFRSIVQYDKDLNFIAEYASIRDAELAFGKKQGSTLIWHCLNHKKPSALGYIWCYSDEEPIPYCSNRVKKVAQYDKNGNLIKIFESVKDGYLSVGGTKWLITLLKRGGKQLYKNYLWEYA